MYSFEKRSKFNIPGTDEYLFLRLQTTTASTMQSTNTTERTLPITTPTSADPGSTGVESVLDIFVVVLKTSINAVVVGIVPSSVVKLPVLNVNNKKTVFIQNSQ